MIYGIIGIVLFTGIILYLDHRIATLENKLEMQAAIVGVVIYDFLKRNKKNIKSLKIDKETIDELFK